MQKENNTDYQLAPPGMHRRNASERAIRTFKGPDFLIQNWDRLLEQVEITLNLVHPSRLNPRLPFYLQLNG